MSPNRQNLCCTDIVTSRSYVKQLWPAIPVGCFIWGAEDQQNNRAYLQALQQKAEEAKRMGYERQLELYEQMIKTISEALEHGSKEAD